LIKQNIKKDKYMITYASAWNKGLYKIIEMFEKLLKINNNYVLHLMTPGYEIHDFENYKDEIQQKFKNNIVIHNSCDKEKYSNIISKSICVFAPNFKETFGCVFTESYFLGTNVLYDNNSGAVYELVNNNYCCDYSNVLKIYKSLQNISINDVNVNIHPKFLYKNIIVDILKLFD